MAREPLSDLLTFLKPFDKEVQKTALKLRVFVLDIFPEANELIYDNYNALAIGYSLSDKQKEMFCHIAVYSKYVNLGFDYGVQLEDPKKMLKGTGNRIRHLTVKNDEIFPETYVKKLLKQSYEIVCGSLNIKHQSIAGLSMVKSVSANKKRPR